jgi:hypothetical protein
MNTSDLKTPTSIIATITANPAAGSYGLTWGGTVFEASDPSGIAPAVGALVLADYLPSSRQWIIVATL